VWRGWSSPWTAATEAGPAVPTWPMGGYGFATPGEREDIKALTARSLKRGGRVGGSAAPVSGGSDEGEVVWSGP
jgi:hypothetical protein